MPATKFVIPITPVMKSASVPPASTRKVAASMLFGTSPRSIDCSILRSVGSSVLSS
jgi:hypothetical protein